uniref:EXPERA domain-containing protein n=1 Tax=Peronospora matthiolae TaxID=2874970 RepID=A0AAV1UA51_9STRA
MTIESHGFAAAVGALVPSLLLLLFLEKQWARELPPQCSSVLDRVLWLDPDAIFPHFECLGVSGRALYLDYLAFDLLLFPLIYATALHGLLRRLWPERHLVWCLPGLAALCDVCENVSILELLRRFPQRWQTLERGVSVLTRAKWIVLLSANVFVVLGIGRVGLQTAVRKRTTTTTTAKDE